MLGDYINKEIISQDCWALDVCTQLLFRNNDGLINPCRSVPLSRKSCPCIAPEKRHVIWTSTAELKLCLPQQKLLKAEVILYHFLIYPHPPSPSVCWFTVHSVHNSWVPPWDMERLLKPPTGQFYMTAFCIWWLHSFSLMGEDHLISRSWQHRSCIQVVQTSLDGKHMHRNRGI